MNNNNRNNDQGSTGSENANRFRAGVAVAGANHNGNGSSVSSSCCSDEDEIEAVAAAGRDSAPPTRTVSLDGNHGTMLDRVHQQFATRTTKPRKEISLDKKRKAKSPLQEKIEDAKAKKTAPNLDVCKKDPSGDEPPSPVKKTRRRSCDIKKKPKDMPRRPLSAYNLFFKEERSKVLAEREASLLARQNEPAELPDTELFATLGKTIAARWKILSSPERERFKALAAEDMKRYRLEMHAYQLKREMTEAFLTPGMFMGDAGLAATMGAGVNLPTTTTNAVAAASLRAFMKLQYPRHPTTPPFHTAERQLASSSGSEMQLQNSNRGAANEFIGSAYQPAPLASSSDYTSTGTAGMSEILHNPTTTLFNPFPSSTPTSSSFLPASSMPPTLPFASQDLSNIFSHVSNLAAPQAQQTSFNQQLQSPYTNHIAQSQQWQNQQQQEEQELRQDFTDQDIDLQQDLAQLFAQHAQDQVNPLDQSASVVKLSSSDQLGHTLGQIPQQQQSTSMIPHRQGHQSVSSSMTSWMQPAASGVAHVPEMPGPLFSLQQSQQLLLFQEQHRQQEQLLNAAIQPRIFDSSSLHFSTQESEPQLQVSQSAASSRNEFRYPYATVGIQSADVNQATVMLHSQLQQQQQQIQQEQQQQREGQQMQQQQHQQDLRFQF